MKKAGAFLVAIMIPIILLAIYWQWSKGIGFLVSLIFLGYFVYRDYLKTV